MTLGAPGSTAPTYQRIKLTIKPEPKFLDRRQQEEGPPAHLLSTSPRVPSHVLLPMQPIADRTADILATPHITLEHLADLEIGDTVVYGSGTRREVVEMREGGAIIAKTTKKWLAEEVEGQFCSGLNDEGSLSSQDYLFLEPKDVLHPKFEVAEGNGTAFTIVHIEISRDTVRGVTFSFQQVFPQGFAADIGNIIDIVKQ